MQENKSGCYLTQCTQTDAHAENNTSFCYRSW